MSFAILTKFKQWRNYVRRGEAVASGRQAAGSATEFNQNDLETLLFNKPFQHVECACALGRVTAWIPGVMPLKERNALMGPGR